jgi:hypothetical protein
LGGCVSIPLQKLTENFSGPPKVSPFWWVFLGFFFPPISPQFGA